MLGAAPPMRQPLVALLLNPQEEAPHVAIRQPHQRACLHLGDALLHHLTDHMQALQFLHAHHNAVLSDHPALLVKAGSLSTKRTFLRWPKRTFSCWDYSISLIPALRGKMFGELGRGACLWCGSGVTGELLFLKPSGAGDTSKWEVFLLIGGHKESATMRSGAIHGHRLSVEVNDAEVV